MLGDLAIAYLFLGGAGAGALVVCCLTDLLWLKEPFGRERVPRGLSRWPVERLVGLSMLAGLLMVAAGAVCLTFDLGRVDRVISLLLSPPASLMNWGSWALVALIALSCFAVAVRFLAIPAIGRGAMIAVEAAAVPVAVFVMAYTGFLLQTLYGARFWGLWPVVALFVLSSLSCGIAVPVLLQAVVGKDEFTDALAQTLLKVDVPVIVLEVAVAVALLVLAGGSNHPGIQASFASLVQGPAAAWWWAGFAVCGLALPFACEAASLATRVPEGALRLAVAAAIFVLIGGVSLRVAIADVGSFRPLELSAPASSADEAQAEGEEGGEGESSAVPSADPGTEEPYGEDDGNWGAQLFGRAPSASACWDAGGGLSPEFIAASCPSVVDRTSSIIPPAAALSVADLPVMNIRSCSPLFITYNRERG